MDDLSVTGHVTLLLDGLSRAAILPFGPILVQKLLRSSISNNGDGDTNGGSSSDSSTDVSWNQVSVPFALAVVVYILGRFLGNRQNAMFSSQHAVGRLAGVTFALHLFSLGAGLTSVRYLLLIRFLAGFLSGYLTRTTAVPNRLESDLRSKSCWVEGTAKIYTIGFALSALFGGLIYKSASVNPKFEALTGQEPFTLTPMFFVFCSVVGEVGLRFIFWSSSRMRSGRKGEDEEMVVSSRAAMVFPDDPFGDPLSASRHNRPRVRLSSMDSFSSTNRQRLDTGNSETSLSEFYDCEAFDEEPLLENEFIEEGDEVYVDNHGNDDVAIYRDNMVVYEKGNTPAFVPQGDCEAQIPLHYMEVCSGNERKARTMYQATQRWRWQNNVWRAHKRPQPHFEKIKEAYPHFLHGHTKEGCAIIYEQPGKMDLKTLFRNGCTVEDMVEHLIFFMEFIGNVLTLKEEILELKGEGYQHNSSSWRTTVVMDVTGISMSLLSTDVLKYLSRAGDINNNHYPRTMKRVLLINAPFWLSGAWSTIKGIVPDSVPVDILSPSKTLEGLRKHIDDDQIPELYGGSSVYKLGEHPYENYLKDQVATSNAEKGFGSQPVMVRQSSRSMQRQSEQAEEDAGKATSTKANREAPVSPIQPLRRRALSSDRERRLSMEPIFEVPSPDMDDSDGEFEGGILTVVSLLLFFWSAVQGSIEYLMPFWILTPPMLGGLGYQPSQAGTSLFCACVVLLWTMRTKVAKTVAQTPGRAPMRAFRVGVGTQFVLLILISAVPNSVVSVARAESVLNMTSTVILFATMALSSMSGRSAISILHHLACSNFVEGARKPNSISAVYGLERLVTHCQNGKFTLFLMVVGEICGILAVAPIYDWSVLKERPSPFDASCCFYVSSFVTLLLYVASFSLHLNNHDEFVNHPGNGSRSNLGEFLAVPLNDVISLLEDAKLSSPPDSYSKNRPRVPSYAGTTEGPLLKKV